MRQKKPVDPDMLARLRTGQVSLVEAAAEMKVSPGCLHGRLLRSYNFRVTDLKAEEREARRTHMPRTFSDLADHSAVIEARREKTCYRPRHGVSQYPLYQHAPLPGPEHITEDPDLRFDVGWTPWIMAEDGTWIAHESEPTEKGAWARLLLELDHRPRCVLPMGVLPPAVGECRRSTSTH